MPFAIFRRHQRKLLAIFAILAMFGFVVADSLPRMLNGGTSSRGDTLVVELNGRKVYRSEISGLATERINANLFISELSGMISRRPVQKAFGDTTTRSLVDALILREEADRLGMPTGPEIARAWLRQRVPGMTPELFELILSRFNDKVSGEQILDAISGQIRIANVRDLIGAPTVTPLDVFNAYRDQTERVSARAVAFRTDDFLNKVGEPSQTELLTFYNKYKDRLPDPDKPNPGFKVPREIQAEILSLDGEAIARGIKGTLTEPELLSYYENRKNEFRKFSEFPDEIFQGQPDLTPPQVQPFADVKVNLAVSLADERAATEILNTFSKLKDEVMIPFADKYLEALDEIAEAKKDGTTTKAVVPSFVDLKAAAKKEGLEYDLAPLLSHERAEKYGIVSSAEVGLTKFSGGRKFAEELFDAKTSLYEPLEFTDPTGHRYLVRKIKDVAPRVPSLDEIKAEVILAWKTGKARPLAEKAAQEYARTVKSAGGKIKDDVVDGRPVIITDAVARLQPGLPLPGQFFESGPATPSEILMIPGASAKLRESFFNLKEGDVEVGTNNAETAYYVFTLNRRNPAMFSVLYAPNGDYMRYRAEAVTEASRKRFETWMAELRNKANLPADWAPGDETKG